MKVFRQMTSQNIFCGQKLHFAGVAALALHARSQVECLCPQCSSFLEMGGGQRLPDDNPGQTRLR